MKKPMNTSEKTTAETAAKTTINWNAVDWSQKTTDIAKVLGVTTSAVSQQRHRYAPDTIGPRGNFTPKYDWSKVDWGLKDFEIAQALGCSKQAVYAKRKNLGK